jgi:hypothetical protein
MVKTWPGVTVILFFHQSAPPHHPQAAHQHAGQPHHHTATAEILVTPAGTVHVWVPVAVNIKSQPFQSDALVAPTAEQLYTGAEIHVHLRVLSALTQIAHSQFGQVQVIALWKYHPV